jgi:hypothetical protein
VKRGAGWLDVFASGGLRRGRLSLGFRSSLGNWERRLTRRWPSGFKMWRLDSGAVPDESGKEVSNIQRRRQRGTEVRQLS